MNKLSRYDFTEYSSSKKNNKQTLDENPVKMTTNYLKSKAENFKYS